MTYRPSSAGFELNAGSAFAGIIPASIQAAVIGTGLLLAWLAIATVVAEGLPDPLSVLRIIPGVALAGMMAIIIATGGSAFYIALVGAPLAMLLADQLGSPLGFTVAVLAALLTGIATMAVFGVWPLSSTLDWQFALLVFAYALPAGLLYRREVLTARQFNPYRDVSA